MEEIEKEANKYLEEEDKGNSATLEKIDEICEQYRNENENKNKKIADLDEWNISDFFGINDLERIKQTPEYIIEKILIKFKNFINFNEYFFIMKPKEISEENKNNKKEQKGEKKEKDNIFNKKEEHKEMESFEITNSTKKNQNKSNEGTKKKTKGEEKKKISIKNFKTISPNKKLSNSMISIQSLDIYKNNLNIYAEEKHEKVNNFNNKISNSLSHKKDKKSFSLNIKNFSDSSGSNKPNKFLHRQKDYTNNNDSSINKFNINISSNESSSKKKDISSITKNKLKNNSINISSENKGSSEYYNFQLTDSQDYININRNNNNKEENKKKENMNIYKLRFFKEKLNLEEGENLSGKAYEEYARKVLKLMFILSLKNVPDFKNPQNIVTEHIIDFYKNLLESGKIEKIDTPIGSLIFEESKKEKHFEIDIVLELKKKEIIKFVKKYGKIIFFENYFINENDNDINEEVTCYMEIARNLVSQGKEKLIQIKKYIKIIKIMNNMRQIFSDRKTYNDILMPYKTSESTEKIFSIITDGNYEELKFVINEIVIPKLNEEPDYEEIKKKIEIILNENPNLFEEVENKDSLIDNIYYVLEIFYHLKINKIKFCLIYIGEICESKYNLTNVLMKLKNDGCLNDKGEKLLINDTKKKNDRFLELKSIYKKIKNIILEFEKKCENYIEFSRESVDKIFDKFDYNIFDFAHYISQMKFEFNAYIFYNNKDEFESLKKDYKNIATYFKKYFKLKIKQFQLNGNNLRNILNYIEQDIYSLYFLFFEEKSILKIDPSIFRYKNMFVFQINKNKESQIYLPFKTDKLIEQMSIESKFRDAINQDIKNNLPFYLKPQILMPTNLESKLLNDLKIIFKVKGNINIKDYLEKLKFEIPKEKEDELLNYIDKITEILKIKDSSEIKDIFTKNLNKLILNLLSKHIYFIFVHKIGKHFRNKYEEELSKSIENFNKSKKYLIK